MELPHHRGIDPQKLFSVYAEGREEARRFKWIESEKANCDLGETALLLWSSKYWWRFLRSRWMEHLEGRRFCSEFNADQFGLLERPIATNPLLLDRIVDRVRTGQENLEIIDWAVEWRIPSDPVHDILALLRINDARLPPPFEQPTCQSNALPRH